MYIFVPGNIKADPKIVGLVHMPLDDAEVVDLHEQVTCLDLSIVLHIELDDTFDEWHQGLLQLLLLCLFPA